MNPVLLTVPPGELSTRLPDAPSPTTALILSALWMVKFFTGTPPIDSAVTSSKEDPDILSILELVPIRGLKALMVGMATNPIICDWPPKVVTSMLPDGPEGASAVIVVGDTTVKFTPRPPIFTLCTSVKWVPVIVTILPAVEDVGVKDVMVGGAKKVKPALVAIPLAGVTIDTVPDAPVPTTAVMVLLLMTWKEAAGTPPK